MLSHHAADAGAYAADDAAPQWPPWLKDWSEGLAPWPSVHGSGGVEPSSSPIWQTTLCPGAFTLTSSSQSSSQESAQECLEPESQETPKSKAAETGCVATGIGSDDMMSTAAEHPAIHHLPPQATQAFSGDGDAGGGPPRPTDVPGVATSEVDSEDMRSDTELEVQVPHPDEAATESPGSYQSPSRLSPSRSRSPRRRAPHHSDEGSEGSSPSWTPAPVLRRSARLQTDAPPLFPDPGPPGPGPSVSSDGGLEVRVVSTVVVTLPPR